MANGFINPYSCVPIEKKIAQIQNVVTNIVNEGLTYTAGCGIDVTGSVITAAIDGVSIICEEGVLSAVAASDLEAGCGITIADGVVSAAVDGTTIECVEGVLVANLPTVPATPDCFKTIEVSGQSSVVADSSSDTLTLVAGTNITITTDASTDTITINSSGGGGGSVTAGTYIDVDSDVVSVDFTEVAGWAVVSGEYQGLVHDGSGIVRWMDATICNPPA